jgi:DMSO reductase family type II enzyme heme b subunit
MKLSIPLVSLIAAAALLAGCTQAPVKAPEVVSIPAGKLPLEPNDPLWNGAPEHLAKLVPQDLVEPRLMTPSTPEVKVRSINNGAEIAFRLEWADPNQNDKPGPASMIDACAVQIPEQTTKDAPDPQMGQDGKTVQITYWRADWQAIVNGRGDTIQDLYPNATVDHYPFEAKALQPGSDAQKQMELLYSPARALGNDRGGPRTSPVEDLIATGPGTLTPGPSLGAKGKGTHSQTGWTVVISRKLPPGLASQQRTQVAFAVWQGSQHESGARKMRTGWVPLLRRGQ